MFWVTLDGVPATEIAPHTPPTWETLADGGNGEASFELATSSKSTHHAARVGALMVIWCGCVAVWRGRVADYERDSGRVVGRGIHTDAYGIPALDLGGAVTRHAVTAVLTAEQPPWSWYVHDPEGVTGLMGLAAGDSTDIQMVGQLYDQIAEQQGKRWGQDAGGHLYFRSDPTTPSWLAAPDSSAFGTTDEDQATRLIGVYLEAEDVIATPTIRSDPNAAVAKAEVVDLKDRGVLTLAAANAILDAMLAAGKQRTGWVNGVTLSRDQLTTVGGTPAALAAVRAGSMVRANGIAATGAVGSTWLDVVIGKTRYTAGERVIYLEPTSTAPRTFVAVTAAA